jgi:hypothetical protein
MRRVALMPGRAVGYGRVVGCECFALVGGTDTIHGRSVVCLTPARQDGVAAT